MAPGSAATTAEGCARPTNVGDEIADHGEKSPAAESPGEGATPLAVEARIFGVVKPASSRTTITLAPVPAGKV